MADGKYVPMIFARFYAMSFDPVRAENFAKNVGSYHFAEQTAGRVYVRCACECVVRACVRVCVCLELELVRLCSTERCSPFAWVSRLNRHWLSAKDGFSFKLSCCC